MPKKSEPVAQELMVEYELMRQEISAIDKQIMQLQQHHQELLISRQGITSIKEKKDSEVLVPAGAGVYFTTSLKNDKACLVNVGSNVLIEMKLDKAKKTIDERIDQALSMIVKLNEDADAMVMRLRQIETVVYSQ